MKRLLFFLLLLISNLIFAQQQRKLDSLKAVLAKLPAEGRSFAGDTMRVRGLCEMGEAQVSKDSTILLFNKALKLCENILFEEGRLIVNLKFAELYSEQPLKSLEYLMKSLAIAESLKDYPKQIIVTARIRNNLTKLRDFENALKYAQKHLSLCEKYGNSKQLLLSLNSIGNVFFDKSDYASALKYFQLCKTKNKTLGSKQIENVILINIAKVKAALKKYDEALENLKAAMLIDDGYVDKTSFVSNEIAHIYLLQGKYKEALKYAQIAEKTSVNKGSEAFIYVLKNLHDIHIKLDDKNLAYSYLQRYTNLKLKEDSVKNTKLVTFLDLDYKAEKQQSQITQLNIEKKEDENRRKLLITGILASMVIIILIMVLYFFLRKKNKFIETQNLEIEDLNKNLELKVKQRTEELSKVNEELIRKNFEITEALFRGQSIERKRVAIELHDNLGGTLSAIKWRLEALNADKLAEKEKKIYESILGMMKNAYSEVRLISHNLLPAEFEEKGLLGAIQKLCDDINQSGKLWVKFDTDEKLEISNKKVGLELYSITMELVNNILKHSMATQAEIVLKNDNNMIDLLVRDNGIGLSSAKNSNGLGLKNLKNRLNSIGGIVEIKSTENWNTELIIKVLDS